MTFTEAKASQADLEAIVARTSAALNAFSKAGPMGMVPDDVKFSPEYRQARAAFSHAFESLRTMNSYVLRTFAKECREERRARRMA